MEVAESRLAQLEPWEEFGIVVGIRGRVEIE
jgi:hypothetical protein